MIRYKESKLKFKCPRNLGKHQLSLFEGELCKIDFVETQEDGSIVYVVHSLERKGIAETLYYETKTHARRDGWPV